MKLFGKELFTFKKEPGQLYDFAQHGLINGLQTGYYAIETISSDMANSIGKAEPKAPPKPKLTPKEVYNLKSLNDNEFKIRVDEEYIAEQLDLIQTKLDFIGKEPKKKKNSRNDQFIPMPEMGPVKFGRDELESIKLRLENRRKIESVRDILNKYPHTSGQLIEKVISEHSHLRSELATKFVPDFPKAAIKAMKEYNDMCIKLCNKKAVFYVIANQSDFQVVNKRRDPILLAQSPFGHFWQILGAWDEEMIFLGDL